MNGSESAETKNVFDGSLDEKNKQGRLSHLPPILQLIITIIITIAVYAIVSLGADQVITAIYGSGGADLLKDIDTFLEQQQGHLNPYRLIQIISTIGIFGLSALIASYLFTGKLLGLFDFNERANYPSLLMVPFIILMAFPVISLVYFYVSQFPVPDSLIQMEESLEKFTSAMLNNGDIKIFAINFMMIAILPAVCEELLFRGVIQRLTTKAFANHHVGILLTGLFFGLVHGQIFKFLPIAVLGILLGYLYWWTKNLWFPIFAHFFHNGIQVVVYFAVARGWINMDLDSPEVAPAMVTAMCAVLFAGVMYLFYNANIKTANESIELGQDIHRL